MVVIERTEGARNSKKKVLENINLQTKQFLTYNTHTHVRACYHVRTCVCVRVCDKVLIKKQRSNASNCHCQ